jgi:hypothetical protein
MADRTALRAVGCALSVYRASDRPRKRSAQRAAALHQRSKVHAALDQRSKVHQEPQMRKSGGDLSSSSLAVAHPPQLAACGCRDRPRGLTRSTFWRAH